MASPQIEDGYTKIANELLEAISRVNLSSYEFRIMMAIIRKTYGFNKKTDYISLTQLEKVTGIKACHVCRTLKKLNAKNMIIKNGSVQGIQKNYDLWTITHIDTTQIGNTHLGNTQIGNEVTQTGNKKLPKQVDTKETIKETYIKDNIASTLKEPKHKIIYNNESFIFENITDKDKELWKGAFPACNLEIEITRMIAWLKNNPEKAHKSNWGKFINNWLTRSQDKGGTIKTNKYNNYKNDYIPIKPRQI